MLLTKYNTTTKRRGKKGVCHGNECLSKFALVRWHTRPHQLAALRFIRDYSRSRFAHLKLGAHFLDLCSLLFKLSSESLYLFVLLRDSYLQLINFEIEHGLAAVFQIALGNGCGLSHGSGLKLALAK